MIKRVLFALAALALCLSGARADFAFTLGTGATAFSFTAATGGTSLCAASVTHCFASVPINTAGAPILTSAAPGVVTGSGTAGTAATGVVTIQGIASGTPIAGLPQGQATSGQTGSMIMAAVTTGAPSYTNAQTSPVTLTTAGDLRTVFSNTTLAVTNAGTFAAQATLAAETTKVIGTVNPGNTANTTAWLVTGTGGTFPVTQATAASLNATVVGTGTFAVQAAATLGAETTKVIGTVRNVGNVGGVFDAVSGAAAPANLLYTGVNVGGNIAPIVGDPCQTNAKSYKAISQTTSTDLGIGGVSAKKTYVCHIFVAGADAENLSLVSGTGTVCATGIASMVGSTTAANGPNLSANGGFSIGNGGFSVSVSGTNADNVCLLQSGSGRVAGVMSYVAQ